VFRVDVECVTYRRLELVCHFSCTFLGLSVVSCVYWSLSLLVILTSIAYRNQGRRHGFESGGTNCASGASRKFFFDPPLFGQWGRQNIAYIDKSASLVRLLF